MADAEILLHEDEHQPSDATASEVIGKRDGDQLERNCELLDKAQPQSILTAFHHFSKLATELRLKIWAEHLKQPRIIELTSGSLLPKAADSKFMGIFRRDLIHVAGPSCRPPAILHVNVEARLEGLRVYSLTNFDRQDDPTRHIPVYYNPMTDIVYFGPKTGSYTIHTILKQDIVFGQVAVDCRIGRVSVMKALHDGQCRLSRQSIRKITFVIPSYLWIKSCNIDPNSCFTPTESTGAVPLQKYVLARLQRLTKMFPAEDQRWFPSWTMDNIPTFEFKCLSPMPEPAKMYYTITVPYQMYDKDDWAILEKAQEQTGCVVKRDLCDLQEYENLGRPADFEVGFYGTPDQVKEARQLVETSFRRNRSQEAEKM